jgi:hypothetical protein
MMHLKLLEKPEKSKPKIRLQREIIKVRTEINKIKTKKTMKRITGTKSWFIEKRIKLINL